jgi:hypothetical protein
MKIILFERHTRNTAILWEDFYREIAEATKASIAQLLGHLKVVWKPQQGITVS